MVETPQAAAPRARRPGATDEVVSILVQAHANAREALAAARRLAQRTGAGLIGVGAEAIAPLAAGPATGIVQAQWTAAMDGQVEARLDAAHALFDTACAGLARPCRWEQSRDLPLEAMARAAQGADLVVAGHATGPTNPYADAGPGELAMICGRPVLFTPPGAAPLAADRIVLAWKDTREARVAMSDGLPFLRAARQVLVLSVEAAPEAETLAGVEDVAETLRRRGVGAKPRVVASARPGACILDQARSFEADLIVAGCFGHMRLRERIFGGVTRELLAQRACHVLLSH